MIILGLWEHVGRSSSPVLPSAGPSRDHPCGLPGGLFGQPRRHADVGVAREDAGGVTQQFLDDFDVDLRLEHSGCGAVPQIMKPDRGQAQSSDELVEVPRDLRWVQFCAVGAGEDAT